MIEHIVKNNEDVSDILNMYHIDLKELKNHNTHITDFKNLLSGTKLMIPLIHPEIEQILDKTEAFVMDYYPQITEDIIPAMHENTLHEQKQEVKLEEVAMEEKKVDAVVRGEADAFEQPRPQAIQGRAAYPGVLPPKRPYKGIK